MDELHGRCVMKIRMPRTYSVRVKMGLWLIGLAGRVIHMPTEIEIVRRDDVQASATHLKLVTDLPKPKK